MKTKQNILVIFIVAAMFQPFIFMAQQTALNPMTSTNKAVKPTESERIPEWKPVKLDEKGSNLQNGVYFYTKTVKCGDSKVVLSKIVNSNVYAVKVAYQISPENPMVYIMVPASVTLEGTCNATDSNLEKLMLKLPDDENARKKAVEHLLSHLVVSKIQ